MPTGYTAKLMEEGMTTEEKVSELTILYRAERKGWLNGLREVRAMIEKRAARNASRAKAMKEQFPDAELYGETEQTYLAFLREDSVLSANIDNMIEKEGA